MSIQQPPRRPDHWLPHESVVYALPETSDGACELTLEMCGRIVASDVFTGGDSTQRILARFRVLIHEEFDRAQQ